MPLTQKTSMKVSITGVVALLAGAFAVHSQGTVSFANYLIHSPYIYVSLGTTKIGGPLSPVPGNDVNNGWDWTVALYGNAAGKTPLVQLYDANGNPVTANLEVGDEIDQTPGTWISTAVADVPGTTGAGQAATVQVYAWYNDGGTLTSYAAAVAADAPTGFSGVGTVITGGTEPNGGPVAPALLPALGNITLGIVVPEPSVITNFSLTSNQFGFDITGTTNLPVVVEACTDLAQPVWVWQQQITLTNGLVHFSEPFQTNSSGRFYRIRWSGF
jgi:hypothetical protein